MASIAISQNKYDAYKPSGFDWIGDIPEHWAVEKLGALLRPISVKNQPALPLLSITRERGVIVRDTEDQESNHNFIPDDLSGYKVIQPGQFGMNKMKAWQGSYGVSQFQGLVSPAYFIFDFTREIVPSFFHLAIRSKLYVSFFGRASDGVRIGQWDLSKSRMKAIPFVIPPPNEQEAIATFVEQKTDEIDRAIAAKEEQISRLNERRQAIIQDTVLKGLDKSAALKPTSVPWVDAIPAHWDVKPLCAEVQQKSVINCPERELLSVYLDRGVIRFSDVEEKRTNATSLDLSNYQAVDPGDFVLNNQQAWRGSVGVSLISGIVSPAYIVLSLSNRFDPRFANYLFRSPAFVAHYLMGSKGVGTIQRNLYWPYIKRMPVFIPPLDEQSQIADFIEGEASKIDHAIDSQIQQIEKLSEYKASLVRSAVTGKIKIS
ncbi:hypothetical protein ACSHT0_05530 [Tepidicaulis sp. LMO-SS28]|uniref:hypothetical protein n=1 Tax=Tepidicaulis sp. LMO-SS28 TaxID=3447455 RepID=UPI003EE1B1EF